MTFELPRQVTLRDGTDVTLRIATRADVPGLHALNRVTVEDGRGVVRLLGDLPDLDSYRARAVPKFDRLHGGREGAFVAAVDASGRVVGEGQLERGSVSLCAHTAMLSIQVHPVAQRKGLGRLISDVLLDWARAADPAITRIGLFTRADNHRAIALYEALGFEREGLRRRFVRLPDGTYVDDVVMGLLL